WGLPQEAVSEMAQSLDKAELQPKAFTLLHTAFTDYGKDKEWPPEKWAELAKRMRAEGHHPLALWTPADLPHVEKIVALADGALPLAPATPSLHHLMALLDSAHCVIGTDSGPVHLAAKRGTKTIALFGPTDPVRFAPPGPTQVIYAFGDETPPPRDRSQRSPRMDAIKVDEVLAAL
ncbi:MAG: glycosyltransferase family 9 protein, partial [Planctomycetes bacterium]|nr:glycosyltransferase family 9 protein [Planctomycetota bacterium]